MRRSVLIGIGVVAVLWLGLAAGRRYIDGLSLVIRAADLHGVVRRIADLDTVAVTERLVVVPLQKMFLLHGRDDNVIPSAESRHLADRLRGHLPVRLLVTDLISHAEADQPAHLVDVLKLAGFWGDLLAQ